MSAYVVDDVTMQRAVAALVSAGLPAGEASALGRKLWAMNAVAVESRYPDDHEELGTHVAWAAAETWQWDPAIDATNRDSRGCPGERSDHAGWPGDGWRSLSEVHYQCAERVAVDLPLFKAIGAALVAHERATTPPPQFDPAAPRRRRQQRRIGPADRLEF